MKEEIERREGELFGEEVNPLDDGLFLPEAERKQRYTAEQARQMEWRAEAALYMLAMGCPVEDIGRVLHMNHRTIRALAARQGERIANWSETFATRLLRSAGADVAVAETKRDEASLLQLVTAAGIKMDKALALQLSVAASEAGRVLEVERPESAELKAFREKLLSWKQGSDGGTGDN